MQTPQEVEVIRTLAARRLEVVGDHMQVKPLPSGAQDTGSTQHALALILADA